MSGLFGAVHLDGAQIDPSAWQAMHQAMLVWGQDGGGVQTLGPASLGACLRHATQEDVFEAQPLCSRQVLLVASARLDNHDALCQSLLGARPEHTAPGTLIAAAYQRHGVDCVHHLRGDWAFALWDTHRQRLMLARDATGNTSMYWWSGANRFVFSSALAALLLHPDVPQRPDASHISAILTSFQDPANLDATAWQGVRRLAPGHRILVDASGARLEGWWAPDRLQALPMRTAEEFDEAFVPLYREAVKQRVRTVEGGQVALTLSAGLDSGSVAALAAPLLRASGHAPVKAYVHRPLHHNLDMRWTRMPDEYPMAELTARHIGHIEPLAVDSNHVSVLQSIEMSVNALSAPHSAAGNVHWINDLMLHASRDGARVLLTGQGGNGTVSYSGSNDLLPQLRTGELRLVLQEVFAEQSGPVSAFYQRVIKPMLRPAVWTWRQHRRGAGTPEPWRHHAAINQELALSSRLMERMRAAHFDPTFTDPWSALGARRNFRMGSGGGGSTNAFWSEMGAAHGLDVRDPTRDQQIVEFCLRVPDHIFWGHGLQRALVRRGMRDLLPPAVLKARLKGLQSADIGVRLLAEQAQLNALLDKLARHELAARWLNIPVMRAAAAQLGNTVDVSGVGRNTGQLCRALAVGLFLLRF